jgi:hypothetical protein
MTPTITVPSKDYVDLLEQALDLRSHALPNASLDEIHVRALRVLVADAYVDPVTGKRCRETRMLELHHEHAQALGGPATAKNLTLR